MIGMRVFLALLAAAASGSACAMASTSPQKISCAVQGEDKLPPGLGGQAEVCSAVARAALPALERAGIAPAALAVTVKVTSGHSLSAVAVVNGRALPEQKVGVSDRALNARAVEMLAAALAGEIAKLGG